VAFSFEIKNGLPEQYYVSTCFSHPPNEFSVHADTIRMVCSHYSYMSALTGPGGVKPVTVCEVLANPGAYNGKNVALLGRLDDSHFDGSWLSEENCGSTLTTDGHTWPNKVWIGGGASAPDPPLGLLVLDPKALLEKLASVRRTTALREEEIVGVIVKEGKLARSEPRMVRKHWEVIFGRIEARERLRPPSGDLPRSDWGNGFGHMNLAPVQIIGKQENTFSIREETVTP